MEVTSLSWCLAATHNLRNSIEWKSLELSLSHHIKLHNTLSLINNSVFSARSMIACPFHVDIRSSRENLLVVSSSGSSPLATLGLLLKRISNAFVNSAKFPGSVVANLSATCSSVISECCLTCGATLFSSCTITSFN